MKKVVCNGLSVMLVVSLATVTLAQGPGPGGDPTAKAMEKLAGIFGKKAFTARVEMTMSGSSQRAMNMEFNMAVSDGKFRTELDFGKMMASAGAGAGAGQMPAGMDKMVTITLPSKKIVYQVMPGMKGYCEMIVPGGTAGQPGAEPKIERKAQGTENVEGHSCNKMLNTVTSPEGVKTEITTWEAKDLNNLPIKTEVPTPDGKMTMVYKDIKTDKPADSLFEIPAGYTKYGSMQELMMSGMMKMMAPRR
jgi:hypothetical protein